MLRQSVNIFVTDLALSALIIQCLLEERLPDRLSRLKVEVGIVDGKVDAALEGQSALPVKPATNTLTFKRRITLRNQIGREKEDTLIILQLPQENRDEGISIDVSRTSFL